MRSFFQAGDVIKVGKHCIVPIRIESVERVVELRCGRVGLGGLCDADVLLQVVENLGCSVGGSTASRSILPFLLRARLESLSQKECQVQYQAAGASPQ